MSRESFLQSWIDASAKIVGGCCRTAPEDTAKICQFLHDREKDV